MIVTHLRLTSIITLILLFFRNSINDVNTFGIHQLIDPLKSLTEVFYLHERSLRPEHDGQHHTHLDEGNGWT